MKQTKKLLHGIWCTLFVSIVSTVALHAYDASHNEKKTAANAQQEITGQVTSAVDGQPLPGASVMIKGTSRGVITDFDGNYKLETGGSDAIFVFSYVGFKTQEVPVDGQSVINISLEEDLAQLDEVVVVGYGTQKRSDVTGAVVSVPKERLSNLPVTNLSQAIQGTTAGLNINQNSSVPGSTGEIQIRGVNSINANTGPFIVVDGSPFFGTTNDINPGDIESIEILKDASAVAIYGTRGSNGVILITTKRGLSGKPRISYNGYAGIEDLSHKLKPRGPEAYVQKYAEYIRARGLEQTDVLGNTFEIDNYNAGITTDWLDAVTRTGTIQEHNISVSGGTEKVKYYVSGGYLDQEGVVKGYQFNRVSLRSNLDMEITDYLKVGTSAFFTSNNYDGGRANFLFATAMSPYSQVYNDEGGYEIYPMSPEQLFENPMLGLATDREERDKNLSGNVYAELTPGFIEGLKYRLNISYVHRPGRLATYSGRAANDNNGTANIRNNEENNWVIENILTWNKDFGKHHIDVTALYSAQETEYFATAVEATGFVNDELSFNNISAAANISPGYIDDNVPEGSYSWKSALLSQMGRVNYTYDSRYLFTLTARRDGYSAFGGNTDKYGVFPSLALGWNIHNENFLSGSDKVNQLKLRFSYGETGNQAISANQTVTTTRVARYPFGGAVGVGSLVRRIGNADLNWETTASANIGLDFGFFDNRIRGSIEAYRSKTRDILLQRNLPRASGTDWIWENLGKMQNTGLEITLNTVNIQTEDFSWQTDINFSTNKNKILDIYGDGEDDIGNRWFIGKPLEAIYDYKMEGIWQEGEDPSGMDPTARPGDIKFADLNEDGSIDAENDRTYLGTTLPKWYGGLTNTFRYKNFHLSVFLQTAQGGLKNNSDMSYADEAGRRNTPREVGYWTPENESDKWPSLRYTNTRGYGYPRDNSYIRIKDVRLSYSVPSSFLETYGVNSLTLYLAGRNLYTFTDWIGWDPENDHDGRGSNNWENNYPLVRTISFGLNLSL
ncbi:SusC/RagA family TonB-linked outer membrane protein [Sinomicrobium weinanense]|uniref:TonB-dependent receptor n=1 Tax=Sinomicrobium weinanense TaxID=2842200 RepID=A0A926JRR3_9FLAO|nr:TonB-dependent receptor [Sinomicrobium weinanense]MBC9796159.1 TonB-dependent receptor [Sinomicrobium weinanense]MBU3121910.1 TonB-dependent receptor [Sinomicrobium weinanense]